MIINMEFAYYNLEQAGTYLDTIFRQNIRRGSNGSILPVYRRIRKNDKFYSFGDYPIMSFVLNKAQQYGKVINKGMILRMCGLSKEYKDLRKRDKMRWVGCLETPAEVSEVFGVEDKLKIKTAQKTKKAQGVR